MPDSDPVAVRLAERVAQAQEQRAALVTAIESMRLTRSLTFADDEHDPEGSTVSLDQARDAALLHRVEQSLAELAAAQERLAASTYGSCQRCGGPIPAGRLEARPEARFCLACAAQTAS